MCDSVCVCVCVCVCMCVCVCARARVRASTHACVGLLLLVVCFEFELVREEPCGSLFANEEKKRLPRDAFDYFAPHSGLTRDVTIQDSCAQAAALSDGCSHSDMSVFIKTLGQKNRVKYCRVFTYGPYLLYQYTPKDVATVPF